MTREDGCFAVTFERKYYHRGDTFIKRCLRPEEFRIGFQGLYTPRLRKERLINEAELLRYIRQHTDLPVPTVYCDFEDSDAYYVVMEYIDGIAMSDLGEDQKVIVGKEVQGHLVTLRSLKSMQPGGPSGLVIPPYRVMCQTEKDSWQLRPSSGEAYWFCHNDLSQQNVVVDVETLKIKAILDWEYAGFYPAYFEREFFTRLGPSVAIAGEVDDSAQLLEFLQTNTETG